MAKKAYRSSLLILTIGLGTLLNPLNSSMISVALTRLQNEFELSFADASWLISIFYLASAVGQPVMGKLSDMFGAKKLFISGLIIVATASVLALFSPNFIFLLGCRALQAIGSSTLFPSGMSIVRMKITEGQGRAIATLSIFASTSAAFGPSIGGFLIAAWDWQAIFIINLPFILLSLIMAVFILPKTEQMNFQFKQIDFVGITLFIVAITGLILFLLSFNQNINWWALIVFLGAIAAFYKYENIHPEPFIDIDSLKSNPTVTFIYVHFMIINLIFYCYFFGFPTFLQQVKLYNEQNTGLIMLSLAGFGVVVANLAGRIIDKYGSKIPMIIGASLLLVGTGLLLTYKESSSLLWLIVIMAVLGMSNGFNNITLQTALYEHVNPKDTGSASGLYQTSRYLGAILSSCLLGVVFTSDLDIQSLHNVAIVCFVFCIIVLALALRFSKSNRES